MPRKSIGQTSAKRFRQLGLFTRFIAMEVQTTPQSQSEPSTADTTRSPQVDGPLTEEEKRKYEVHGTLGADALKDLSLPDRQALIEQLHGLNGNIDDIGEKLSEMHSYSRLITEHTSFLDNASYTSWKTALETALGELNTALKNNDYQSFNRKLDAYNDLAKELHGFIAYEKQQGLVGICADSGIRIYAKDGAVWLCTPDQKAFSDLNNEQQQRLKDFVKGLTGVDVDFSKAVFQQESESGNLNLLGCRLDQLALKPLEGDNLYTVATHVRAENDFEQRTVSFSLKDLQEGKIAGLLGNLGNIPMPKLGGEELSPELVAALRSQVSRDAAYAGIATTVPRIVPGEQRPSPVSTEKTPERVTRQTRIQTEAEDRIKQRSAKAKKVDVDTLDSPEKLSKALAELDEGKATYNSALQKRLEHLEAELKRAPGNSRKYQTLAGEIDSIRADHARGVLLEKEILQKQLTHAGDPKAALPIKARLYAMASETDAAYEQLLGSKSLDDTARKALQAERTAFKTTVSAIEDEVRGTLGRAYDRLKQTATRIGQTEIRMPGTQRVSEFLAGRALTKSLTQAGEVTALLDATELSALDGPELSKQGKLLQQRSETFRPQIKRLEDQIRAGNTDPALQQQLDTLKTADARATIRRAEILERELTDASPRKAARIREQLYKTLADDIEDAYSHLGNDSAKTRFAETRKQQTTGLTALNDDITQSRARIESLEEGLHKDPSNQKLQQDLHGEQQRLRQLQNQAVAEKITAAEQQLTKLEGRLSDVDRHLASADIEQATKVRLESERVRLQQQRTETLSLLEQERAKGVAGNLREEIAKLREEAQRLDASKETVTDPAQQADLEKASKKVQSRILQREAEMIGAELEGTNKAKLLLEDELKKVTAELEAAADPSKTKPLSRAKKQLEGRLKGLQTAEEYLKGQKELISLERTVKLGEGHLEAVRKELSALEAHDSLTPEQQARRLQLNDEVSLIETKLTESRGALKTTSRQFKSVWAERLNSARKSFDVTLERAGARMQQNPMKTATVFGAIAEGLRMAGEADVSADSRHTFLPSLIYMLDSDLDDWIVPVEFTTEQTGESLARAMEFTSGAGNAAIVIGGISGVQKVFHSAAAKLPGSGGAGSLLATKAVGRTLSFAGAGLDGYLTFSNLDSWQNADDVQLLTKTASPIAMGAGFGAFFGPVGAGVGAAGGAVGEIAGVTHAVVKLDRQIEADWRKRGVRDSIRLAEEGFVYPESHPTLLNRSRELNEHEQETINELVSGQLLERMFSGEFSPAELQRMGFKLPGENAPAEERQAAGEHNYQRLKDLLEPPSFQTFPLSETRVPFTTNASQELRDLHPNLAQRLENMENQTESFLKELYHRGTRVSYENVRDKSTLAIAGNDILHSYSFGLLGSGPGNDGASKVNIKQDLPQLMAEAGELYKREMARAEEAPPAVRAELGWRVLADRFPQLGQLLAHEDSRRTFFSMFNSASGVNLEEAEMWTLKAHCETGMMFCQAVMPGELTNVPRELVAEQLRRIDQMSENLE